MLASFQDVESLEEWLVGFKFARARIKAIQRTLALHKTLKVFSSVSLAEQMRVIRDARFEEASLLFQATDPAERSTIQRCGELLIDLKENPLPSMPLIDGKDLAKMGFRPGPIFKRILREVEDQVLERKITLKSEAQEWIRSKTWD